jgi:hypothetical protein
LSGLAAAYVVLLGVGTALSGAGTGPAQVPEADYVPPPPVRAEYASATGKYIFVVATSDNWQTRRSSGSLYETAKPGPRLLWTRALPHEWRPRHVVVSDAGNVLLLDEWANIASRVAVMLLSRANHVIAVHDYAAILRVLEMPAAKVARAATLGTWIQAPPAVVGDGSTVTVAAAGKVVGIDLSDGRLFVAPQV